MRYKYSAKHIDTGRIHEGEIEAPNERAAINNLRGNGLVVYALKPLQKASTFLERLHLKRGASLKEIVKFTDQIANMVAAGLSLTKALELVTGQTKNKKMKDISQLALNDVESGMQLSDSLRKHPDTFNTNYISLVKAGEASGKLGEVLRKLAHNLEKQQEFRSKVRGAMIYPTIITIVMIAVFMLIIIFLLPKMTEIYDSFDIDLPFMTLALIGLSNFTRTYWWLFLLAVFAIISGYKFYKATPAGAAQLAKVSMILPIFGKLVRYSSVVEFTRSMGILMGSGVPITESLEIVQRGYSNPLYKKDLGKFIDDVKHGDPLSKSVASSGNFPYLVSQMLVVGEETGTVDQRLESLTEYYEREVDGIVKNLSTALEPLIMVMLGVMVGVLIISVISPIYQLTSNF